jgi:Predicted esterase of the alpha-beta hydrolase superfamily
MTELLPITAISLSSMGTDIMEKLFQQYSEMAEKNGKPPLKFAFPSLRSLPLINRLLPAVDEKKALIELLIVEQKAATTYKKWYDISLKLDELLGNNSWKCDPQSEFYDYDLIYNNLNEMREARLAKDYKLLLYLIRTKWVRNVGNMGDINLYRHSFVGTKKLIEEYIEECQLSLVYLINDNEVTLEDRYLLGMLIQTRKNIGRTALVLSGGSTFGLFHTGVLITLLEANLLPRIISGSSAGSIIASVLGCHSLEETIEFLNTVTEQEFIIFSQKGADPVQGKFKSTLQSLGHFLKYGTLYDISGLKQTTINFFGDLTFREAYNRTGRILNITVSPASIHDQTKLLNYLTAPNCLIWSAVCASCSLPGVFPSTSIYEKTPRTNEIREWNNDISMKYVDGSMDNDLPITRLSEMFNVDHIIAVQVNPHVVPVLKVSVSSVGGEVENRFNTKIKNLLNNVYDFVSCEVIHYLQLLNEMDIYKNASNKVISILSQNYSGDITILPDYQIKDFLYIFENPTPQFLLEFTTRGAKACWPKVTVINNHCGVEFALDKAISLLKGRLITSVNNRLTYIASTPIDDSKTSSTRRNFSKENYLVNSPLFVRELQTTPNTPSSLDKSRPRLSKIKRHNSTSNTFALVKPHNPMKKRNSISTQNPVSRIEKKIVRGKSTTALASLANYQDYSGEETLINDEPEENTVLEKKMLRVNTEGSVDIIIEPSYPPSNTSTKRNIRKAQSSGNFSNSVFNADQNIKNSLKKIKYQSERIPYHKGNPYLDSTDQTTETKTQPKSADASPSKEKPNLPRISTNNAVGNSYIGLNRLKDSNVSSTNNSIPNSNSNSNYNLNGFMNQGSPEMKSLNSPDLRRGLTKKLNRDYFLARNLFISSDNDDDLVKWEDFDQDLTSDERGYSQDEDTEEAEIYEGPEHDSEEHDDSEDHEDSEEHDSEELYDDSQVHDEDLEEHDEDYDEINDQLDADFEEAELEAAKLGALIINEHAHINYDDDYESEEVREVEYDETETDDNRTMNSFKINSSPEKPLLHSIQK